MPEQRTKILLLGKTGQVGWELQRSLAPIGDVVALGHEDIDFEQTDVVPRIVREIRPAFIINSAAYTAVDKAESEKDRARRINAQAVGLLAAEARAFGAWLIHYSTDYVFDGKKEQPYVEDDTAAPLSVYGATKLAGENAVRESGATHLILRTSWVYGVRGNNFAKTILRLAKERDELRVIADQHGTPTSAELIADVTALLVHKIVTSGASASALAGTYHLVPSGETTWCEYAQYLIELALNRAVALRTTPDHVVPIPTEAYPLPAVRPKNSRLNTTKIQSTFNLHLPDWRYHVRRLIDELSATGAI